MNWGGAEKKALLSGTSHEVKVHGGSQERSGTETRKL